MKRLRSGEEMNARPTPPPASLDEEKDRRPVPGRGAGRMQIRSGVAWG